MLSLLDSARRNLFLARDCFGIKPLYFRQSGSFFAFASEVKPLLEFENSKRAVNPERLLLYMRYGISDQGADTLFSDIHQLPPGHFAVLPIGGETATVQTTCYWKPSLDENPDISFDEAASRVREVFLKNVGLHLRSDVPIGPALSGGIDSSAIVMCIRHLEPQAEIHSFSYIAEQESINEERWVDIICEASGAHVHKVRPSAGELFTDLDDLVHSQDEPFGSTSLYAQYRVFRLAREAGVKVMLDGQGADELLGGYRYYLGARLASLLRQERWSEASRFIRRCAELPGASTYSVALHAADYLLPPVLQGPLRKLIKRDVSPTWINQRWFSDSGVEPSLVKYTKDKDVLKESLLRTLSQTSLPSLLRYEDRNSMASSIESRVPFLTRRVCRSHSLLA